MMWRMAKTVLIVGIIGLGLAIIGRTLIADNQYSIQTKDIPQTLENTAMDKLMAEDLAMTTSLFLKQLSAQMQRWADSSQKDELPEKFSEEINEHPHFHGFAILDEKDVEVEVGEIERLDASKLTHTHMNSRFSDPYSVDGKQYMLMGEKLQDGRTVLGEIDLTFVQQFVKDLAFVADANGSFFVSGADPDIGWKTTDDMPENLQAEIVPELGWQIVVQSDNQKPEHLQHTYHENQAVIKFKRPLAAADWFAAQENLIVKENHDPFYVVESPTESTEELIGRLRREYDLEIAEPNYIFTKQNLLLSTVPEKEEPARPRQRVAAEGAVPNDEFFQPYQWNLNQIYASQGWNLSGGEDVTIAVLDTGVDPNHLDLKDKLLPGFNAFDESDDVSDSHGHGTHVAGIAAALTNNVTGIAGVSWKSQILPVKVLNEKGEGSSFEVAKGIYWAVDHGADVINMSLGDYYDSEALHDAIRYAYEQDVVLITASGNDNVEDPMYPSRYDEVLTVAAVDDTRNRAFFSNYGQHVDVAAPGEHIPSLFPDNNYTVMSGTSMAAPHVAGLAGLIRALRPDLTNQEVYDVITSTAEDLGTAGHDPYYGFGEINIVAALESVS